MFLGESGHFHFWVNVTTFTFAFFHFCFLNFGPFVILNCSSCQKNATDEGAIALKALDFQINVKNCISYFNIGGQKKKSVEQFERKCNPSDPSLLLRVCFGSCDECSPAEPGFWSRAKTIIQFERQYSLHKTVQKNIVFMSSAGKKAAK